MTFAVFLTIFLFSWLGAFPVTPATAAAQEEWVRSFPGTPVYHYGNPAGVAVDPQGNVYVTGAIDDQGIVNTNFATIKYGPGGEELWVRYYEGAAKSGDAPMSMALDSQGNVLVTGVSRETAGSYRPSYTTIKYNPDGEQIWLQQYPRGEVIAVAVDQQDNVYVTGTSPQGCIRSNYLTIKYSADGFQLWTHHYNGPGNGRDEAASLAVDRQGNIYVTGASWGGASGYDFATIKYSPDGESLWKRRYNSPFNGADRARGVVVDSQGNVYVTGESWGGSTGFDFATVKYGPDGKQHWVRRYRGGTQNKENDTPVAIAVDGLDNIYITGSSRGKQKTTDYLTLKYSPAGQCLWAQRYNGPRRRQDTPTALVVDGQDNVYVTGYSRGTGTGYNNATIKYSPDGEQLWEIRHDAHDSALAVDALGNVYVTGQSYNGSGYDIVTIKYNQE